MNFKFNFKENLVKVLIVLIILLLILVSFLIKKYFFIETEINSDSSPAIDREIYKEINQYLNQNKNREQKLEGEDVVIKDSLNNLNKLRTALFLYMRDHQQLPDKLNDLTEEYLLNIPIEPISDNNKVNNDLDLTGGWYYNPPKTTSTNLLNIVRDSLRPNINLDYSQRIKFAPYQILINRKQYRLYILQSNKKIKSYPIGIGASNTPTPAGVFRIKNKVKLNGRPKETYGKYWLGIDLWTKGGGYGIHATTNPKVNITEQHSKGCIRMKVSDLEKLYIFIPIGTKVIIQ